MQNDIIKRQPISPQNRQYLPEASLPPDQEVSTVAIQPGLEATQAPADLPEPITPELDQENDNPVKKSSGPVGVIIFAVIVCLCLISLALYAGMQTV